jgi:hypothetical protein
MDCHTGGKLNVTSLDSVTSSKDAIIAKVNNNVMPPAKKGYQPLSDCEKEILETWLNDPNNTSRKKVGDLAKCQDAGSGPVTAPTPTPKPGVDFKNMPLNFANIVKYIYDEKNGGKCLQCHSISDSSVWTTLDEYSNYGMLGLLGKTAEESKLYKVVIHAPSTMVMPPEDSGVSNLSAEQLDFLKRWIDAGAPEK